jgi:hypothetical protein
VFSSSSSAQPSKADAEIQAQSAKEAGRKDIIGKASQKIVVGVHPREGDVHAHTVCCGAAGRRGRSVMSAIAWGLRRGWPAVVVAMLWSSAILGCGLMRRPALKVLDPGLRAQPRLERSRLSGGYGLGPYAIQRHRLVEIPLARPIASRPEASQHPGHGYDLEMSLRVAETGRTWSAQCSGKREPTVGADFGAVSDETNDAVVIDCDITGPDSKWSFQAQGQLDRNFGGELRRRDDARADPLQVEILMWIERLNVFHRHLPDPVAQIRHGKQALAAMVLSRPQWAWLHAGAPPELQEVSLTVLVALDLLPLGLEG